MAFIFKNIANIVTAIGIILTIWLNFVIWNGPFSQQFVFILVVGIALSDLLDGWIARKLKITSSVGEFLDKIRDKLFSCSAFTYFFIELWKWNGGACLALVKGLVIISLAIELFLVLIWIRGFINGLDTSSHFLGKIKTTFYFIAIGWWFFVCLIKDIVGGSFEIILYSGLIVFLFISSIYGILSASIYVQRHNDFIEEKKK